MIDLIRKRHEGDAWVVFTELANATGGNVSRHADAAALGLWPSRGHELHGYELKASRGDVQKELKDPRKADAVGKYCDYWWLVVEDLRIIDGLVIPETWGVLYPKQKVLRVHRKAPKLEAKPPTRGFAAAMIRNVTKSWVPRVQHEALKEKQRSELLTELERDRKWKRDDAERRAENLEARIKAFEEASGVSLDGWQAGDIGRAVQIVLGMKTEVGIESLKHRLSMIENQKRQLEWAAAQAEQSAHALRKLLEDQANGEQRDLPFGDIQPRVAGLHG